jgi:hypothetical protein
VIPPEEIPNADQLYYRVHVGFVKHANGKLRPNCFRDKNADGMSTDWSKYATPEQTRRRGAKQVTDYGIAGLPVEAVRLIEALTVVHVPRDNNDAHSHVLGLSTAAEILTRQRYELYNACGRDWLIPVGAPDQP